MLLTAHSRPAKYDVVLIGFNPVTHARTAPIEKWVQANASQPTKLYPESFYEVASGLQKLCSCSPQYVIINPVVGPEVITVISILY